MGSMNLFRMVGDMCHVWSTVVIARRLVREKNAHGISLKSQELYLVVFVARYLDLFTTFYSLYNSCLKILYIASTAAVLVAIRCTPSLRSTCDTARDTFQHWKYLALPSLFVAIAVHYTGSGLKYWDTMELLWTWSICLEPVAILPQLVLIFRYREIEGLNWIYEYILFKGLYRALYICNWIYRSNTEKGYQHHWFVYICGVLQTLLYLDFLCFYLKRVSFIRYLALLGADMDVARDEDDDDDDGGGGGDFELLIDDVHEEVSNTREEDGSGNTTGEDSNNEPGEGSSDAVETIPIV